MRKHKRKDVESDLYPLSIIVIASYAAIAPGTLFKMKDGRCGVKSVYTCTIGEHMAISLEHGTFMSIPKDEEVEIVRMGRG